MVYQLADKAVSVVELVWQEDLPTCFIHALATKVSTHYKKPGIDQTIISHGNHI